MDYHTTRDSKAESHRRLPAQLKSSRCCRDRSGSSGLHRYVFTDKFPEFLFDALDRNPAHRARNAHRAHGDNDLASLHVEQFEVPAVLLQSRPDLPFEYILDKGNLLEIGELPGLLGFGHLLQRPDVFEDGLDVRKAASAASPRL